MHTSNTGIPAYKTKRKLVDVIEIGSKFPNVVATIFAYVSLPAPLYRDRSLKARCGISDGETYRGNRTKDTDFSRWQLDDTGSGSSSSSSWLSTSNSSNSTNAGQNLERWTKDSGSKKKIDEREKTKRKKKKVDVEGSSFCSGAKEQRERMGQRGREETAES